MQSQQGKQEHKDTLSGKYTYIYMAVKYKSNSCLETSKDSKDHFFFENLTHSNASTPLS